MKTNIRPIAIVVICLYTLMFSGCDGDFLDEVASPADTDSDTPASASNTQVSVDQAQTVAEDTEVISIASDTDSPADSETESGDDSEAAVEPAPRVTGEACVAPSRDEYMASYGVTADDKDLSDPNVLTAKAHTILFIFDKSGSMGSQWNADDGSKWEIARDTMIAAVSPFQEYLSAGAVFFSLADDDSDVAKIDSGLQINYSDGASFLDNWDENMGMYGASGGTPLMEALETADDAINVACAAGLLDRPFKVMLITDGMPSYWDSNRGLELISDWYDRGISTSVVGMPGSTEASQILSDIAAVGSGGEIEEDGSVDDSTATAEEIVYTADSTTEEFTSDMLIACE